MAALPQTVKGMRLRRMGSRHATVTSIRNCQMAESGRVFGIGDLPCQIGDELALLLRRRIAEGLGQLNALNRHQGGEEFVGLGAFLQTAISLKPRQPFEEAVDLNTQRLGSVEAAGCR